MKESERWRKLAEAVHNGDGFVGASIALLDQEEFERAPAGGRTGIALAYGKEGCKADTLYALLLAEEAEDDEEEMEATLDAAIVELKKMQPAVTVTGIVEFVQPYPAAFAWADPEPVQADPDPMQAEPTGLALGNYPPEERRSTWNEKVARGMRKWADWWEARF